MFSHTFRSTILCATVAMAVLVPVAQADDWAADWAPDAPTALDPAIATAIRESKSLQQGQRTSSIVDGRTLDAIEAARGTAGRPRTSRIVDGRSLDTVEAARLARFQNPLAGVAPLDRFHWDDFGIGAGSAFGSVLLLAGLAAGVLTTRRRRNVNGLAAS
jgi:hypothetical protein